MWPWPSTYLKKVSNDTTAPQEQKLCKIILKSMHKWRSYDPGKSRRTFARMHAFTHARTYTLAKQKQLCLAFLQGGSTKRNNIHVYILEQTPKSGYIYIQFMLLAVIISSASLLVNIIVMSSNTSITSFLCWLCCIKLNWRSSKKIETAY